MTSDKVRQLSPEELALVCGGTTLATVTVTPDPGPGYYDPWPDYGPPDFYDPWDQPYYGGGGGGENTTEQQIEELAKDFIEIAE